MTKVIAGFLFLFLYSYQSYAETIEFRFSNGNGYRLEAPRKGYPQYLEVFSAQHPIPQRIEGNVMTIGGYGSMVPKGFTPLSEKSTVLELKLENNNVFKINPIYSPIATAVPVIIDSKQILITRDGSWVEIPTEYGLEAANFTKANWDVALVPVELEEMNADNQIVNSTGHEKFWAIGFNSFNYEDFATTNKVILVSANPGPTKFANLSGFWRRTTPHDESIESLPYTFGDGHLRIVRAGDVYFLRDKAMAPITHDGKINGHPASVKESDFRDVDSNVRAELGEGIFVSGISVRPEKIEPTKEQELFLAQLDSPHWHEGTNSFLGYSFVALTDQLFSTSEERRIISRFLADWIALAHPPVPYSTLFTDEPAMVHQSFLALKESLKNALEDKRDHFTSGGELVERVQYQAQFNAQALHFLTQTIIAALGELPTHPSQFSHVDDFTNDKRLVQLAGYLDASDKKLLGILQAQTQYVPPSIGRLVRFGKQHRDLNTQLNVTLALLTMQPKFAFLAAKNAPLSVLQAQELRGAFPAEQFDKLHKAIEDNLSKDTGNSGVMSVSPQPVLFDCNAKILGGEPNIPVANLR